MRPVRPIIRIMIIRRRIVIAGPVVVAMVDRIMAGRNVMGSVALATSQQEKNPAKKQKQAEISDFNHGFSSAAKFQGWRISKAPVLSVIRAVSGLSGD